MVSSDRIDKARRVIRASRASIYRALLDGEARGAWVAPEGMTGRVDRFDPSPGGGYRMVLTYDDPRGAAGKSSARSDVVESRFVDIVPERGVVESVEFESDDTAFAGAMTMTWTLTSVAGGTEVRVTAANVPDGISAEDHEAGMRSSLENLAAFVE